MDHLDRLLVGNSKDQYLAVLSYIQGTDSKSSGNAFLNVVQKRDFQGSTGEDHFVIKNEIFEISQEDGVFEIEIEQDNHSYFKEINPR